MQKSSSEFETPRPETLNERDREAYEERAAILQHDAGLSRERAEKLAWEAVTCRK